MKMLQLKCRNFHGNISTGLLAMFEAEELVNVTIAVDGKHLKAHQMVLSICSPYFKSLLLTNTCKHPIIFLKDVKYDVMEDLLHFMYEGHVQVHAEHFQAFIDTARALQITWLTDYNDQNILEHKKANPEPQQKQTSSAYSRNASKRLSPCCKANTHSDTIVDCGSDHTTTSKKPKFSFGNKENKNENGSFNISTTNSHNVESTNGFLADLVYETVALNVENQYEVFVKTEDEDAGMSGIDNFNKADDVLQQMPDTCREEPNTCDTQLAEGPPDEHDELNTYNTLKPKQLDQVRYVVDGYVYLVNATKGDTRYLRCVEYKRQGCHGRALLPCAGTIEEIKITHEHSHESDPWAEEKIVFARKLKDLLISGKMTAKQAYDELSPQYPNASNVSTYSSLRSKMNRWRRGCMQPHNFT